MPMARGLSGKALSQELAIFYRCLSVLLNSGVQILRSLEAGAQQCSIPPLAAAIGSARGAVASGKRLSVALTGFPSFFTTLQVRMIAVGENTGGLHVILERLAEQAEKSVALRQKVASALTYPLLVLGLALLLLLAAPALVFKDLLRLFSELGVELPWTTRLMLFAANLLSGPWPYLLLVLIGLLGWYGYGQIEQHPGLKARWEAFLLAVPGLGTAFRMAATAEFCGALALCYSSGLPVVQAVTLCAGATGSVLMEQAGQLARQSLLEGETLYESLRASQLLTPVLLGLLAAGEESGQVASSLEDVAEMAEANLEVAVERATALLEPLVLLVIGGVVGFMVIATLSPLARVLQVL